MMKLLHNAQSHFMLPGSCCAEYSQIVRYQSAYKAIAVCVVFLIALPFPLDLPVHHYEERYEISQQQWSKIINGKMTGEKCLSMIDQPKQGANKQSCFRRAHQCIPFQSIREHDAPTLRDRLNPEMHTEPPASI